MGSTKKSERKRHKRKDEDEVDSRKRREDDDDEGRESKKRQEKEHKSKKKERKEKKHSKRFSTATVTKCNRHNCMCQHCPCIVCMHDSTCMVCVTCQLYTYSTALWVAHCS